MKKTSKRILVCGAGSIGQRHIQNLIQLGAEVSVWRARAELLNDLSSKFLVKTYTNLNEAIQESDGVVVATSTDQHLEIALKALKFGSALFIEKPISNSWDGIEDLIAIAKGKVIEVGFQFRAHPNLIKLSSEIKKISSDDLLTYRLAMGHRLDAWRNDKNFQASYSANVDRGGGALFDLIHQIDIAIWFFGPIREISSALSNRSGLGIKGDDIANIILTHHNGIIGHIQLDMASPINRCEAEIITKDTIFYWNNFDGNLIKTTSQTNKIILDSVPDAFERNDLFYAHMQYWLERIDNLSLPPLCSLEEGIEALKVVLTAHSANNLKKTLEI